MNISLKSTQESFSKNGISLNSEILSPEELSSLNRELDYYFSKISLNGSIGYQFYDKNTKIFDHTHMLASVNFEELMVRIAEHWRKLFPEFDGKSYILTRASIKQESGAYHPILWHRDRPEGTLRNIFYLIGGGKDSGEFRFVPGSHKENDGIDFALTRTQYREIESRIADCPGDPGDVLFFDANGFHCNYPRVKTRRSIILTWCPAGLKGSESRIQISSSNLTQKVIENIQIFANPKFVHFEVKDYDFNPPYPAPPLESLKNLFGSLYQHAYIGLKVLIKSHIDRVKGVQQKYDGSFLNEKTE